MPASVPDEKDEQKIEMIKSTLENGEQVGNLTLHIIQVPAPFFPPRFHYCPLLVPTIRIY